MCNVNEARVTMTNTANTHTDTHTHTHRHTPTHTHTHTHTHLILKGTQVCSSTSTCTEQLVCLSVVRCCSDRLLHALTAVCFGNALFSSDRGRIHSTRLTAAPSPAKHCLSVCLRSLHSGQRGHSSVAEACCLFRFCHLDFTFNF